MDIKTFIDNNDVDFTKNTIALDELKGVEAEIGFTFGPELKEYITQYGYLGFRYIEFYGINSVQKNSSDMVSQTKYLHKYFPKTIGYIAIENCGDGKYCIVAQDDFVYEYYSETDELKNTDLKLFQYILKSFSAADH